MRKINSIKTTNMNTKKTKAGRTKLPRQRVEARVRVRVRIRVRVRSKESCHNIGSGQGLLVAWQENKTRQDKTRQDKTRQDKTRQGVRRKT
jgi:hypothetical protein